MKLLGSATTITTVASIIPCKPWIQIQCIHIFYMQNNVHKYFLYKCYVYKHFVYKNYLYIYFGQKYCVKKYYVYKCYVHKFYNKNILLPTSSIAKTRRCEVAA